MWRWVLALVASVALAVGVTGPKLCKMAQIKGWLPGAQVSRAAVTAKGVDRPQGRRQFEDSYWVCWAKGGDRGSWAERERVAPKVWQAMRVGDPLDLVRVPGDRRAYLRNGVFVDWGNFAFDLVLFAGALAVAVASVVRLLCWRLGRRRATPGPVASGFSPGQR